MSTKLGCAAIALLATASAVHSAEPGTPPVPKAVSNLKGCWKGRGEVMGKPVTIGVSARSIVQDAILALDVQSQAVSDPKDLYSAHLIFGGTNKQPGAASDQVVGYWSDSFGGAFATSGQGETRPDGFDMTYRYTDDAFVNHWRFLSDGIAWQIVSRDRKGIEKPFASYSLHKASCRAA
jgi:hypothetical protein